MWRSLSAPSQTFSQAFHGGPTSAIHPKTDIRQRDCHVRFAPDWTFAGSRAWQLSVAESVADTDAHYVVSEMRMRTDCPTPQYLKMRLCIPKSKDVCRRSGEVWCTFRDDASADPAEKVVTAGI